MPPPYGYSPTQPLYAPNGPGRLRPMGIGDVFDTTFRLYRENFGLFIATTAIVLVPILIVGILFVGVAALTSLSGVFSAPAGAPISSSQFGSVAAFGLAAVAAGIVAVVAFAAMYLALVVVISQRYLGRPVTIGAAYRTGLRRVLALIVAYLWAAIRIVVLVGVVVAIAAILFNANLTPLGVLVAIASVALFIYLFYVWQLMPQAIVLENVGGIGASKRSRQLIKGYWWKTFGITIMLAILTNIIDSIPSAVASSVISSVTGSSDASAVANGIITLVMFIVTQPLGAAVLTLLFYDLKIRKEAFDLEVMAQASGAMPPAEYPATRY